MTRRCPLPAAAPLRPRARLAAGAVVSVADTVLPGLVARWGVGGSVTVRNPDLSKVRAGLRRGVPTVTGRDAMLVNVPKYSLQRLLWSLGSGHEPVLDQRPRHSDAARVGPPAPRPAARGA